MKISYNRWKEAQQFEAGDWLNQPNIVKNELLEAKNKYSKLFLKLQKFFKVNSNTKILDVGCSLTCISLFIEKGQHFGIEPLADQLDINNKVKGITVVKGVGENIPYGSETFDIVICRNVIDHTHNPSLVISEISRVLKPKGHLFLASYVYHPFIAFIKNLSEATYITRNIGHPHTYNPQSFLKLVSPIFTVKKNYLIYTGQNPHDFGKVTSENSDFPFFQKIILFISQEILRHQWFVKEVAVLCQKK